MALQRVPRPAASERTVAILCVIGALLLWGSVKLSALYVTEVSVPMRYQLPAGLTFASPPTESVLATVAGTGWELLGFTIRGRSPEIAIDSVQLGRSAGGEVAVTRPVERAFASTPLTVRRVTPERVAPSTSQVATARLPVQLRASIGYAEGFAGLRQPRLIPDSVTVTGPASTLSGLTSWPTDTASFVEVRDSLRAEVALAPDPSVRLDPPEIKLMVGAQQVAEARFEVPVFVVGAAAGDSIVTLPAVVRVSAAVGVDVYSEVSAASFLAVVDVADVTFADTPVRLPVLLERAPEEVLNYDVSPPAITAYRVSRTPLPE